MLGFGFNKAKVLASADRNVKQGKLQNAIADYERILQEDPNDLNVLNTIGDLYARLGDAEKATTYFQRVGDAYASDGFTVKAIAMYKKLTKQNPASAKIVQKLADLYAQQGLNNDARVQYTVVADLHLRNGDPEAAAAIFQKMLELDPDNPLMQSRLAEIYVRLGKKQEARDIFFRSAQTLRSRGAREACDEALAQVVKLDPAHSQAILLRGEVRLEVNDFSGTVESLERLPDLDSRPEALRMLLKSQLKLSNLAEAEPLARKLLAVFNDISGIRAYGESLMAAGDFEAALHWYDQHAIQLLSADTPAIVEILYKIIAPLKNKPWALEKLSELFQKAGNTMHLAELTELLAHASVQEGALEKARDLYKQLGDMEPENPLHVQNYRQILARLESDASNREEEPSEPAEQAPEQEFEPPAPSIEQHYSPEVGTALQDAFTDAELFESYNLPSRAIAPLKTALSRAPRDLQVNRRLLLLYIRTGQMADAAKCCQTLESVCADAGFGKEAGQYRELANRYAARAGVSIPPLSASRVEEPTLGNSETAPSAQPAPAPPSPPAALTAIPAPPPESGPASVPPPNSAIAAPGSVPSSQPAPAPAREAPLQEAAAHEIDLSDEWERVLTSDQSGAAAIPEAAGSGVPSADSPHALPTSQVRDATLGDIVEEAQFYISQSMLDEARGALSRAEAIAPQAAAVVELRAQLAATTGHAVPEIPDIEIISAPEAAAPEVPPATSPGADVPQTPSASPAYFPEPAELEVWPAPPSTPPVQEASSQPSSSFGHEIEFTSYPPAPPVAAAEDLIRVHEPEVTVPAEPELDSGPVLTGIPDAADLSSLLAPPAADSLPASRLAPASSEELLDSSELLGEVRPQPAKTWPVGDPEVPQAELLDLPGIMGGQEFLDVLDVPGISSAEVLEIPEVAQGQSLAAAGAEGLEELELPAITPIAEPLEGRHDSESRDVLELVEPLTPPRPHATPELLTGNTDRQQPSAAAIGPNGQAARGGKAGDALGDLVLELEESLGQDFNLAGPTQTAPAGPALRPDSSVPPPPASAPPIPAGVGPVPEIAAPKFAPPATAPAAPAETAVAPETPAEGGALADLFAEFKHELESAADQEDDPETHYNLGVAFKEMGLFDEAIGELQKVCKSVERGHPFAQVMQAYTWLADCFLQNGMPEAGIHWYMKALQVPGLDQERTVAVHYELACAHEAAGNVPEARNHFMRVLSINIDYRDVAERIKALKS